VETAEQVAVLLDQQCDEGQGFFFSHPVVAEVLTPMLISGAAAKLKD